MIRETPRRILAAIAILLAIALAVGAVAMFRDVRYLQGANALLAEVGALIDRHRRLPDFDDAMRHRGFSPVRLAPGQACGWQLKYFPLGTRCVRYSGHDVHMDVMVGPDERVLKVVPGWG